MDPMISPPKRSIDGMRPSTPPQQPLPLTPSMPSEPPTLGVPPSPLPPLPSPRKSHRLRNSLLIATGSLVVLVMIVIGGAWAWYQQQLQPMTNSKATPTYINIDQGETAKAVGADLQSKKVIRSAFAFELYMKVTRGNIKAGRYSVSAAQSVAAIAMHIESGKQDQLVITLLPGDTLANDRQRLLDLGYSAHDVDGAFAKTYTGDLFAGKPAGSNLEGYLYGETYQFDIGATPDAILQRIFDYYDQQLKDHKLVAGFAAHGLTTFQAITLASIVQREVGNTGNDPASADEAMVAGIFYNRIKAGMMLGSDVTFQYAAKLLGVPATPDLNSPYNTRIHTGLPPGPIATPGLGALEAVANPTASNNLFFISGDNGTMYYAQTDQQHEQNVQAYCKIKCQ